MSGDTRWRERRADGVAGRARTPGSRRRTKRWRYRGAAFLLVGPLLAFALHTHAQTLVTNEDGAESAEGGTRTYIQAFTTGSNPAGYRLEDVWVDATAGSTYNANNTHVRILPDNVLHVGPNDLGVRLISPDQISSGFDRFEAPEGTVLEPDRTYYVALNAFIENTNRRLTASLTESLDEVSPFGWSIGDTRRVVDESGPVPTTAPSAKLLRMRLTGCEQPDALATTSLVSNKEQAVEADGLLVQDFGSIFTARATGFTTGGHPDGYEVKEVLVHIHSGFEDDDVVTVFIRTARDEAGELVPDTLVSELESPATITDGDFNTFTVPSADSVTLAADTTYFVVVLAARSDAFDVGETGTDEDESACLPDDWSIDDRSRINTGGDGWRVSASGPMSMAVRGVLGSPLAGLTISYAVDDATTAKVTLEPAFDAATTEYTADVPNSAGLVTILPQTRQTDATIDYLDGNGEELADASSDAGFQMSLGVGNNTVEIVVNAGLTAAASYVVTLTREELIVPTTWSLKPDGVEAGEKFRLLFVSSTTRDTHVGDNPNASEVIGAFNGHVQAAAAAGHADIQAMSSDFTVVGSTPANYQDMRRITRTPAHITDVAIYWVSTTATRDPVAVNYADFYDWTWADRSVRTESGTETSMGVAESELLYRVATGSHPTGRRSEHNELASYVGIDRPDVSQGIRPGLMGWWLSGIRVAAWLDNDCSNLNNCRVLYKQRRFLGLSPVLRVEGDPPVGVLLRNDGEPVHASNTLEWELVQGFDTGGNANGFRLDEVWLPAAATPDYNPDTEHVRIYSRIDGTGGAFGDEVVRLDSPDAIGAGMNKFTAPRFTRLEPNTRYYLTVNYGFGLSRTDGLRVGQTASEDDQSDRDFGWTLDDYRTESRHGQRPGTDVYRPLRVRMVGEALGPNSAPEFIDGASTLRSVPENTDPGTAIGLPVEAGDVDGDAITYSLAGSDMASFGINADSGQLTTSAALDHETKDAYEVTVEATDVWDNKGTIAVAIEVTNRNERPDRPAKPTVTATTGVPTSVDVSWTAPGLNGGPEIVGYRVRHRTGGGVWSESGDLGTGTTHAIAGLLADTVYEVQVRALNGELDSDWSESGYGPPGLNTSIPVFAGPSTLEFEVAEDAARDVAIGQPIQAATDSDGDRLDYLLEGADADAFGFDDSARQIKRKAPLNYEEKVSYSVTVKATDHRGGEDTVAVTITVTDVDEAARTPKAPDVGRTQLANDSLDVTWKEPGLNGGPEITGYKLQYRTAGSGGVFTELSETPTVAAHRIDGLTAGTEYEVQVKALNGELDSEWSLSGTGFTNRPPAFTPATAELEVAENTMADTAIGTPIAAAADPEGDRLTYTLGGTDATSFAFDAATRQISTTTGVVYNHEGSQNTYSVTVKAVDPSGAEGTMAVTIEVTDEKEAPDTPAAPTAAQAKVTGTDPALDVAWTKPGLNGGPDITGYQVRWQTTVPDNPWKVSSILAATPTTYTITDKVKVDKEHNVQVRALNGETDSEWSESWVGYANRNPVFHPPAADRSVAENVAAGTEVGLPIPAAADDDGHTLSYTLAGDDSGSFDFDATARQIKAKMDVDLDHETKSSYSVKVTAKDEYGGSGSITVAITVTDVAEKAGTPDAPDVKAVANTSDRLAVSWSKPDLKGGPDITGYKLQYRETAGTPPWSEVMAAITGTAHTITGLAEDTEYEVQVRAENGETDSDWSESGTATTGSTDATLSDLTVEDGDGVAVPLDPAFDAATLAYAASVASTVDTISVLAVLGDDDARLDYLDTLGTSITDEDTADGLQTTLGFGTTTIVIKVTASDDTTSQSYTLAVTRAEADAATLTVAPGTVAEDGGSATVTVTATLNGVRSSDTAVTVAVGAGTAAAGTDFAAVAGFGIAIDAGDSSGDGTFALAPVDDADPEYDETVIVTGSTAAGGPTVAPAGGAVVRIVDDDRATLVTNLAEPTSNDTGSDAVAAQSFVVGGEGATYGIGSVSIPLGSVPDAGGGALVAIWTDMGGPDEERIDLATPSPLAADSVNAFAAPHGTVLVPGTYTVSVNHGLAADERVHALTTDSTAEESEHGWSIGDTLESSPSGSAGTWLTVATPLAMGVSGWVANHWPKFDPATALRKVDENTLENMNVGLPIPEATDGDNDVLSYSMGGTDETSFAFDDSTRQIKTKAGLNHEVKNTYSVTVKATDPEGAAGTIAVTIEVEDVAEKPGTPDEPTVTTTSGTNNSLDVSWDEPDLKGGPAITGYKLRYKTASATSWSNVMETIAGTTYTIGGLASGTAYAVQVRALNGETDSDWSPSGTATTGNRPPMFSADATTREVAENTGGNMPVGEPIPAATDPDGDTPAYTMGGTDAGSFAFAAATRQISTKTGVDYDHEAAKNSYSVTVKADDGKGGTDTIAVTIDVTDAAEKPGTPDRPTVTTPSGTTDSLDVSWSKPDLNGGPDITGYKLQYKETSNTVWIPVSSTIAGTTHTIAGLAEYTEYEVQVRAQNGESDSDWSPSGTATTGVTNRDPVFLEGASTSRGVAENTRPHSYFGDPVAAIDDDGDTLEYSLEGTDAASFGISVSGGRLHTRTTLDYETKAAYAVTVRAVDGNGGAATIDVAINVIDVEEGVAVVTMHALESSVAVGEMAPFELRRSGGDLDSRLTLRWRHVDGAGFTVTTWGTFGPGETARPANDYARAPGPMTARVLPRSGRRCPEPGQPQPSNCTDDYLVGSPSSATMLAEGVSSVSFRVAEDWSLRPDGVPYNGMFRLLFVTSTARDGASTDIADYNAHVRAAAAEGHEDIRYYGPGFTAIGSTADVNARGNTLTRDGDNPAGHAEYDMPIYWLSDSKHREAVAGSYADFYDGTWGDTSARLETGVATTLGASTGAVTGTDTDGSTADGSAQPLGGTASIAAWHLAGSDVARTVAGASSSRRLLALSPIFHVARPVYPGGAGRGAWASGARLMLRYGRELDAGWRPGPKDWVVRAESDAGARELDVAGVSVRGTDVVLALGAPAAPGETVAVSYLPWAVHPLREAGGRMLAPTLTEAPVRNVTPAPLGARGCGGLGRTDAEPVEPPCDAGSWNALPSSADPAAPLDLAAHLRGLGDDRPAWSARRLDLPERGLAEVSALAGSTELEVLDLSGNAVVDAWPLSGLSSLRRLNLSGNRIADLAALSELTLLETLDLSDNAVADIWPLAGLGNLRRLDLSRNRIDDVRALSGLSGLEVLVLDGNRVADVWPLAGLANLRRLDLAGNRVWDATGLAGLALERLDLSGNGTSEAGPLGGLPELLWLDLTGNPVSDATPLGRLTRLRWLWLDADTVGTGALGPGLGRADAPLRLGRRAAAGRR